MTPASYNSALNRWTIWRDGKLVYRYRALMEEHIGRPLASDEHVHHINGDSSDDRIENRCSSPPPSTRSSTIPTGGRGCGVVGSTTGRPNTSGAWSAARLTARTPVTADALAATSATSSE